jgi:hypothetical protein
MEQNIKFSAYSLIVTAVVLILPVGMTISPIVTLSLI